jgi:hypothetical protein
MFRAGGRMQAPLATVQVIGATSSRAAWRGSRWRCARRSIEEHAITFNRWALNISTAGLFSFIDG